MSGRVPRLDRGAIRHRALTPTSAGRRTWPVRPAISAGRDHNHAVDAASGTEPER